VPRSEIERIDALGLEVALKPAPGRMGESAPCQLAESARGKVSEPFPEPAAKAAV
jgi:hypothetical protein